MEKTKLFISHSTKDKQLVKGLIDFLRAGLDIKKGEIFCSALDNALPIGIDFIPVMKEKIGDCEQVFFLITENYLESKFSLSELGAAWALNQNIIPVVVPPVDFFWLDDTPLRGIQMINLFETEDLHKLFGHLVSHGVVDVNMVGDFSKEMANFLEKVRASYSIR